MVGEVSDLVTGTDEGRGSNIQLQNALVSTNTDWMNYGGKHWDDILITIRSGC